MPLLKDGSELPSKLYFDNPVYFSNERVFTGFINFGDNTFNHDAKWEILMQFSKDFQWVTTGFARGYDTQGNQTWVDIIGYEQGFTFKLVG